MPKSQNAYYDFSPGRVRFFSCLFMFMYLLLSKWVFLSEIGVKPFLLRTGARWKCWNDRQLGSSTGQDGHTNSIESSSSANWKSPLHQRTTPPNTKLRMESQLHSLFSFSRCFDYVVWCVCALLPSVHFIWFAACSWRWHDTNNSTEKRNR